MLGPHGLQRVVQGQIQIEDLVEIRQLDRPACLWPSRHHREPTGLDGPLGCRKNKPLVGCRKKS